MVINTLKDNRTGCISVLSNMKASDYLSLVSKIYKEDQGGIAGQRAPLKTKTAIRIRQRMIDDLIKGTILPPIVLGVVIENSLEIAEIKDNRTLKAYLESISEDSFSIIDGMQRTTAIEEASTVERSVLDTEIRVEIWFSENVDSLIYRMLVLNTGQVPWDIKRQLSTVYSPVIKAIKKKVSDVTILELDSRNRRVEGGQFQGSRVIELFLAFSSRKVNVDIKEKIAEDFARLEAIEATSSLAFLDDFIDCLELLVLVDKVFGKANTKAEEATDGRFKVGKDLFTSLPVGVGFMAAASVTIFGRPGFPLNKDAIERKKKIKSKVMNLVTTLSTKESNEIYEFLNFDYLNQAMSRKSSKVGEFEREFFFKAFLTFVESADELPTMEPCWASY